jgi:hypothetical protein
LTARSDRRRLATDSSAERIAGRVELTVHPATPGQTRIGLGTAPIDRRRPSRAVLNRSPVIRPRGAGGSVPLFTAVVACSVSSVREVTFRKIRFESAT